MQFPYTIEEHGNQKVKRLPNGSWAVATAEEVQAWEYVQSLEKQLAPRSTSRPARPLRPASPVSP